jgi:hypothetical protein
LLLPDESAALTLTIDIDEEMAAELNQFRPRLEATLILHVGLGKDHFVPVSGDYGTLLVGLHPHTLHSLFVFLGGEIWVPFIGGFTRVSIA